MSRLAPAFDFDYEHPYNADRNNFNDPFHLKGDLKETVLERMRGISAQDYGILLDETGK